MFKSYFLIFERENRMEISKESEPLNVIISLNLLAIPSICLGYFVNKYFVFFHQAKAVGLFSLMTIGIAFCIAVYLYIGKDKFKVPPFVENILANRFYIDKMYNLIFCKPYFYLSKLIALFDKFVVDLIVNSFSFIIQLFSKFLLFFQTGNVSTYILLGVFSFSITIFIFILGFSIYILGGIQ